MRRTGLLLTVVAAFTFASAGTAIAGGWWTFIGMDGEYMGIGEKLKVGTEVQFRTIELAEKARTTAYYAYLVEGLGSNILAKAKPNPRRWWTPPEDAILVGEVELSRWDVNVAHATAYLEIPEVPPGSYHLTLCDAGCRTPLANVIPQGVNVTVDALAAETSRRLDRIDQRDRLAIGRIQRDLRAAERQLVDLEAATIESTRAIARLREERPSPRPAPADPPWWAFGGWFVAGAAAAIAVSPVIRRRSDLPRELGIDRIPDDARDLLVRK